METIKLPSKFQIANLKYEVLERRDVDGTSCVFVKVSDLSTGAASKVRYDSCFIVFDSQDKVFERLRPNAIFGSDPDSPCWSREKMHEIFLTMGDRLRSASLAKKKFGEDQKNINEDEVSWIAQCGEMRAERYGKIGTLKELTKGKKTSALIKSQQIRDVCSEICQLDLLIKYGKAN